MGEKKLNVFPLLMVAIILYCSGATNAAVIQIFSDLQSNDPETVKFRIFEDVKNGRKTPLVTMVSGKKYELHANKDIAYRFKGYYGLYVTSFKVFDPTSRDAGHSTVYWKVDDLGFSTSYDGKNYTWGINWTD